MTTNTFKVTNLLAIFTQTYFFNIILLNDLFTLTNLTFFSYIITSLKLIIE